MGTHTESNYHTQMCFGGTGIPILHFGKVTVCMFSEIENVGVKHTEHKTLPSVLNVKLQSSKFSLQLIKVFAHAMHTGLSTYMRVDSKHR